jgi:1-deoxy-D-xylulose 5-phosphate reductoisomerase
MRNVVILGATGSIGQSALKVARDIPDRMRIVGMSAHSNAEALAAAAREFPEAKTAISNGPDGIDRLVELATLPEADLVLVSIVGTAGLRPALAAIEAGKDIAVASKEILVMAGEIVMEASRKKGVRVLPVDSEHSAIFQCLDLPMSRRPRCSQRETPHPHLLGRAVPQNPCGRLVPCHAGDGVAAPHMDHGTQDHTRLGDPLQQSP